MMGGLNIRDFTSFLILFASGSCDGQFVGTSCTSNVVGNFDENVFDLQTNIESEHSCKQACTNVPECTFYTYFYPNDTNFENYCFLLTEFVGPAQPCPACVTGPVDCSAGKCSLALDGEEARWLMLTDTGKSHHVTISGWGCHLTLLLVGGGGNEAGGNGGAGSGYLQFSSLDVSPGVVLTAEVGDQRQPSIVTLSTGDIISALPGQDSQGSDGGDGFCGGGGEGHSVGGAGGTNGGDGEDAYYGRGGRGTGVDVSSFNLNAWDIGPGAGGERYIMQGGGGGGVLVDGKGPQGYTSHQGQGYGGGASGLSNYGDGLPGVILMEIN